MGKYILDERLSHLSEMQLNALLGRYYQGEKIATLLTEFNIQCLPTAFYKLLPHTLHSKNKCRACGSPTATRLKSRSKMKFARDAVKCSQCEHVDFRNCSCDYCLRIKNELETTHQVAMKVLIEEFCRSYSTKPLVSSVQDISLEAAIALLALVRTCHLNEDGTYGSIIKPQLPYTPRSSLFKEKLVYLLDREIICPSSNSSTRAFNIYDGKIDSFNLLDVNWKLNCVNPELLISQIENCGLSGEWPEYWCHEVDSLRLELALAECQEFYEFCLGERGLSYTKGVAINNVLLNLLRDHSVAQCYRIIWCGATASSDFKARNQASDIHTMNYMAGACLRWADKARTEGWPVVAFRRNFNLPRSMLSYVLYDVMLKTGEKGFNEVIFKDDELYKFHVFKEY